MAKNGVKLCISARREEELNKVKEECLKHNSSLSSNDILVQKIDLLEIDNHQNCFDNVVKHFGKVDVLVNNAGRSQRAEWGSIQLNVDRELFELDVFSIVNLTRIYLSHLKKTDTKGHIAITSSIAGLIGVPLSGSYVGAKHALHVRIVCLYL